MLVIAFPSPIGELHFSIVRMLLCPFYISFRPLSGSYISQSVIFDGGKIAVNVSVPYRGATFLNPVKVKGGDIPDSVSVPYRGATFLNTIPATPCPVWDE